MHMRDMLYKAILHFKWPLEYWGLRIIGELRKPYL